MTALWTIENLDTGIVLGTYPGATSWDAYDAMARDAGYRSRAHMDEETGRARLMATESATCADCGGEVPVSETTGHPDRQSDRLCPACAEKV